MTGTSAVTPSSLAATGSIAVPAERHRQPVRMRATMAVRTQN